MEDNGTLESLYRELIGEDAAETAVLVEDVDLEEPESYLPEEEDGFDSDEAYLFEADDDLLEPTEVYAEGRRREKSNEARSKANARNIRKLGKNLNHQIRLNKSQEKRIRGNTLMDRRQNKQIRRLDIRENRREKINRQYRRRASRFLRSVSGRVDALNRRADQIGKQMSSLELIQIIQPALYRINSLELGAGSATATVMVPGDNGQPVEQDILLNPADTFDVDRQENSLFPVLVALFLPMLMGGGGLLGGLFGGEAGGSNGANSALPLLLLGFLFMQSQND